MTSELIIGVKMADKFVWYLIVPFKVAKIFFSNVSVGA